ncbi:zinc ribbon domain-containing protein [Rhodocaloribacter sp.]
MSEKKKECPSCALPVDAGAEECPYCGYEFPVRKPAVKLVAVLMALLLLGWFAVGC